MVCCSPDKHLVVFDKVNFTKTIDLFELSVNSDIITTRPGTGRPGDGDGCACSSLHELPGAEFRILLCANATLRQIKSIYSETMRGDLPAGQVGIALFIRKDVIGLG